jgi:pheromone shutdown-related protein TraB
MSGNISAITLNNREFILIGTAHVSQESIDEVKNFICEEKPDMVCVELDETRYNSIIQKDNWEKLNLSKVFKEGKGFLLIANLVLAGFQRRLGNELGVKPGEEMKIAVETAKEMDIPYSLCDREIHTTLRRAWSRCNILSKSKLLAALLASAFTKEKFTPEEIENLKQRNELDGMMSELSGYLPGVKVTLIDERDSYLASKIWTSTTVEAAAGTKKRIAAVVGAGHMRGIKAHLEKLSSGDAAPDVSGLDIIPARGIFSRMTRFIIPAVLIGLFVIGFYRAGIEVIKNMFIQWILWNGLLSAIGAAIAAAHPLAILVSFLGAPVTSLIPFIGVGIFSGLAQVTFCKPRVSDVQSITEDITSFKKIYRNRITRALLVFFLSSLGSSTGTFMAMWAIGGVLSGKVSFLNKILEIFR